MQQRRTLCEVECSEREIETESSGFKVGKLKKRSANLRATVLVAATINEKKWTPDSAVVVVPLQLKSETA